MIYKSNNFTTHLPFTIYHCNIKYTLTLFLKAEVIKQGNFLIHFQLLILQVANLEMVDGIFDMHILDGIHMAADA